MVSVYLVMYLVAGICFGLAVGKTRRQISLLSLGMLVWVLVETLRTAQRL